MPPPASNDFELKWWFVPNVSEDEAYEQLQGKPVASFLVTNVDKAMFRLYYKAEQTDKPKHMTIVLAGPICWIHGDQKKKFNGIEELLLKLQKSEDSLILFDR
jgi:hypothetical protein